MNKILEIKNLTKYYGKVLGVENLSLDLYEGEIFGFIGPNGAGKSTTIRSIMTLINKTEGKVLINGQEFTKDDTEFKKMIGYLPSEIYLYEGLTVKEMLDYHENFYAENLSKKRKQLVKLLNVDENKKMEDLSLGNKKKVGIILALMHSPKILILDEPTSGLDPIMQSVFYDLLLEEKKRGTTIIYSTHILSEVSKICDRVGIIKEGHLLKVEAIDYLFKNSMVYVTIESNDINKIKKDLKIKDINPSKNVLKFKLDMNINDLVRKLAKYEISNLLIEEGTLEDIFLEYYK